MSDERVENRGIEARINHSNNDIERDRRITCLERHFDIAMAKVSTVEVVAKIAAGIIITIVMSFASALVWFAQERNLELTKLSDNVNRLTLIVGVQEERQRSTTELLNKIENTTTQLRETQTMGKKR